VHKPYIAPDMKKFRMQQALEKEALLEAERQEHDRLILSVINNEHTDEHTQKIVDKFIKETMEEAVTPDKLLQFKHDQPVF